MDKRERWKAAGLFVVALGVSFGVIQCGQMYLGPQPSARPRKALSQHDRPPPENPPAPEPAPLTDCSTWMRTGSMT